MHDRLAFVERAGADVVVCDRAGHVSDLVLVTDGQASRFKPFPAEAGFAMIAAVNWLSAPDFEDEGRCWKLQGAPGLASGRVGVDLGEDFALEQGHTLFVERDFSALNRSETVAEYVDPVWGSALPVAGGRAYGFEARFGLARCTGVMRIVFLDASGAEMARVQKVLTFDGVGGRSTEGYQDAVIVGTAPHMAAAARIEIGFGNPVADGSDITTSYVFMIRPRFGLALDRPAPGWLPKPPRFEAFVDELVAATKQDKGMARDVLGRATACVPYTSRIKQLEVRDTLGGETLQMLSLPRCAYDPNCVDIEVENQMIRLRGQFAPLRMAVHVDGKLVGTVSRATATALDHRGLALKTTSAHRMAHIAVVDLESLECVGQTFALLKPHITPWETLQSHAGGHPMLEEDPLGAQRTNSMLARVRTLAEPDWFGKKLAAATLQSFPDLWTILASGFGANTTFLPLAFPKPLNPKVSIVIPAHNKFAVTYHCLVSLLVGAGTHSFEVIVVDDGSSDRTGEIEALVSGIKVVRHAVAQGFVGASNGGAAVASGQYVLFLNNDTEVTFGAIDRLVDVLDADPSIGIAGPKLIYGNGVLQEAGGIVWSCGTPWNYGRGAAANDPRFAYSRDADYVSGAALLISKALLEELGHFSPEFAPGYFEDTDLCFKARAAGKRVRYVATSVVVHFEGQTSGTSTASGMKRFQEVNFPKFRSKWARLFKSAGRLGEAPDFEKDRGVTDRVLMIDWQTPRPDIDAGSYAALQEIKLIQSLGFKVTFLPMNVAYLGDYTSDLQGLGVEVIHAPYFTSVGGFLEARGGEFDAIYVTRYNVAEQCVDAIDQWAPRAKKLLCNADLHFLRETRAALAAARGAAPEREAAGALLERAEETKAAELAAMKRFDVTLSYNETEISIVSVLEPQAVTMRKAPWVVKTRDAVPGFEARSGLAFLGGYAHPPNVEAVTYFATEIFARIRRAHPGITLSLYGSEMGAKLDHLAGVEGIDLAGFCDSVEAMHDRHRVFVVPLLSGAGVKGKLIGALANGAPTVASPIAVEGTNLRDGLDCFVRDSADGWVEAVGRLYADETEWSAMSAAAMAYTRKFHSFEHGQRLMRDAFQAAGLY